MDESRMVPEPCGTGSRGAARGGRRAGRGCAIALLVVVLAGVGACAAMPLAGSALWFPRTTIDRFCPLVPQEVVWAPTPAADAWAESYEDATGSGTNYVYELVARTEDGAEHVSYLTVFGDKLDVDEPYLRVTTKGCYAQLYKPVGEAEVPQPAR